MAHEGSFIAVMMIRQPPSRFPQPLTLYIITPLSYFWISSYNHLNSDPYEDLCPSSCSLTPENTWQPIQRNQPAKPHTALFFSDVASGLGEAELSCTFVPRTQPREYVHRLTCKTSNPNDYSHILADSIPLLNSPNYRYFHTRLLSFNYKYFLHSTIASKWLR